MNEKAVIFMEQNNQLTEWQQAYYDETDPVVRSRMVQEQGTEEMQALFRVRHPRKRSPEGEDTYLQVFFELMRISKDSRGRMSAGAALRQLKTLMERLGFRSGQEADETLLYWELRNALRRFLQVTDGDSYGRRFMGMIRLKKEEQLEHACVEVWHILNGLEVLSKNAALEELRQPAALVTRAVTEEYHAHDEDAEARLHHISLRMKAGQ